MIISTRHVTHLMPDWDFGNICLSPGYEAQPATIIQPQDYFTIGILVLRFGWNNPWPNIAVPEGIFGISLKPNSFRMVLQLLEQNQLGCV